ncbi:MAG: LPS biosynthesis glycosyltransferase [Succiniclasticum sp.]|jgi:glycosyl transferase, family 25
MHWNHSIISADRALDRKAAITENFNRLGLEPHFFPAIMGDELSPQELAKLAGDEGLLTKGEIGCALSHLKIYRDFLATDAPYWFVFEDDIQLTKEFVRDLPQLCSFMDSLSGPAVLLLKRIRGHARIVHEVHQGCHILHSLSGSTACAYVINRKAAENLLRAQTPVKFEIDAWAIYQDLGYLKLYSTFPAYVTMNEEVASHSLIDHIASRRKHSSEERKRIKARHVKFLYEQNIWSRKLYLQIERLKRHLQELYYTRYK